MDGDAFGTVELTERKIIQIFWSSGDLMEIRECTSSFQFFGWDIYTKASWPIRN